MAPLWNQTPITTADAPPDTDFEKKLNVDVALSTLNNLHDVLDTFEVCSGSRIVAIRSRAFWPHLAAVRACTCTDSRTLTNCIR